MPLVPDDERAPDEAAGVEPNEWLPEGRGCSSRRRRLNLGRAHRRPSNRTGRRSLMHPSLSLRHSRGRLSMRRRSSHRRAGPSPSGLAWRRPGGARHALASWRPRTSGGASRVSGCPRLERRGSSASQGCPSGSVLPAVAASGNTSSNEKMSRSPSPASASGRRSVSHDVSSDVRLSMTRNARDWRDRHLRACLACGRVWRPRRREDLPDRVPGPHDLPHVRSRVARGRDARDPGPPVRPARRANPDLRQGVRWRTGSTHSGPRERADGHRSIRRPGIRQK